MSAFRFRSIFNFFLSFLFCFNSGVSFAIDPPPAVQMNGLNIDVASQSEQKQKYENKGIHHVLVQFNKPASIKERITWQERGLQFMQYIPQNAYLAKGRSEILQQLHQQANVYGVIDIPEDGKLDKSIRMELSKTKGNFAAQSNEPSNPTKPVKIIFFEDTPFDLAKVLLESHEASLDASRNDFDYRQTFNKVVLPLNSIPKLAQNNWVRLITEIDPPFQATNLNSQLTSKINTLQPGGTSGYDLDGAGVMTGIWDAGSVRLSHEQIIGRATQMDGPNNLHLHASHVAGTMVGSGNGNPEAQGMAPNAHILCFDWSNDLSEMEQHNDKITIHTQPALGLCLMKPLTSGGSTGILISTLFSHIFSAGTPRAVGLGTILFMNSTTLQSPPPATTGKTFPLPQPPLI